MGICWGDSPDNVAGNFSSFQQYYLLTLSGISGFMSVVKFVMSVLYLAYSRICFGGCRCGGRKSDQARTGWSRSWSQKWPERDSPSSSDEDESEQAGSEGESNVSE